MKLDEVAASSDSSSSALTARPSLAMTPQAPHLPFAPPPPPLPPPLSTTPLPFSDLDRFTSAYSTVQIGFAIIIVLLAFASTFMIIVLFVVLPGCFKSYARQRFEAGCTRMFCGCIQLVGQPYVERHSCCCVFTDGPLVIKCRRASGLRLIWFVAEAPKSALAVRIEAQVEAFPVNEVCADADVDCSLCMDSLAGGSLVRKLVRSALIPTSRFKSTYTSS